MADTAIKTTRQASPKIYAYTTPNDGSKDGWVKIGYTERDAKTRIGEQTRTSDTEYAQLWAHRDKAPCPQGNLFGVLEQQSGEAAPAYAMADIEQVWREERENG